MRRRWATGRTDLAAKSSVISVALLAKATRYGPMVFGEDIRDFVVGVVHGYSTNSVVHLCQGLVTLANGGVLSSVWWTV